LQEATTFTGEWRHMQDRLHYALLALALVAGSLIDPVESAAAGDKPVFEKDILPILKRHCLKCHQGPSAKARLDLTTRRGLLAGGVSGAAIRLRAAESSRLWAKLAADRMPPKGPKLTKIEKGLIRTWINEGAPGKDSGPGTTPDSEIAVPHLTDAERNYWAFRPPRRPPVPRVKATDRIRNPVDAFVVSVLESRGLAPSPEAGRGTLLRRLSFDLTGLPPGPEDLDRFLANPSLESYAHEVDRLLASPAYGEHWGRHWLDTAGYADSAGVLSEDRPLPFTWRYRDYVIRTFNKNKPYDRFLQEQLAGDELTDYWTVYEKAERLPDAVVDGLIATGFLRMAADSSRPDFSTIKNADAQYFYPTLNDTLQIVTSTTMGLTIQCARCHSHKFDPISQVDYYRLQAIFTPALRPQAWIPQMNRRLLIATASQKKTADARNAEVDAAVKRISTQLQALEKRFAEMLFSRRLARLPKPIRDDVRTAVNKAAGARDSIQQYLASKFASQLRPDKKTLATALPKAFPEYATDKETLQSQSAQWQRRRVYLEEIRALYDQPGEVTTPLLRRGDPLTPGPAVSPAVPVVLRSGSRLNWTPPPKGAKTSGRRLALARWLTHKDHPLTARVMVNRIWMHHFGRGIVSTPEDFGASGVAPSHPKLLDWLAREFVDSGWNIKHIHRLIVLSSIYRQVSQPGPRAVARGRSIDPDNLYLWRGTLSRLGAEPFRDAVLAVTGRLDPRPYGRPLRVARRPDGDVNMADGQPDNRRSVYIQILRLNPQTLLQSFDQPTMEINCVRRSQSNVATQALTLWNSNWMVTAAEAFADRLNNTDNRRIGRQAIRLAYSRPATNEELLMISDFLVEQSKRHGSDSKGKPVATATARRLAIIDFCHMLLSSNEFAYID